MDGRKLVRWLLLIIHLCLAGGFLVGTLIEFARPPPFFDSYVKVPPETPSRAEVFSAISTVITAGNAEIHRLMDFPILFIVVVYFGAVVYLRLGALAWRLTGVAGSIFLLYFVINVWATDFFDWRYYKPRARGILILSMMFAFIAALTITTVMWKRRRLTFKLKSPFNLPVGGKAHIIWNIIGAFLLFFFCLLMWIGRAYQSYVCVQTRSEIGFLCQMTSQVSCIPCNECTRFALRNCSSQPPSYCFSGVAYDKAFCVFNYSVGYFTFIKLFAYTGGLYFFLRNFLNASSHYLLLVAYSLRQWWRGHEDGIEATWRSFTSRFNFTDRVDLRTYFRSRFSGPQSSLWRSEGRQAERVRLVVDEDDDDSDLSPERDQRRGELAEVI